MRFNGNLAEHRTTCPIQMLAGRALEKAGLNMIFNKLIKIGFIRSSLIDEAKALCDSCHQRFVLFRLANWVNKAKIRERKKEIIEFSKHQIVEINKLVNEHNSIMTEINPQLTIKKIANSDVIKQISEFYKTTEEKNPADYEKLTPHIISSFDLYIFNFVKPMLDQISFTRNVMNLNIESFGLNEVNKKYHKDLDEVVDLHLMGYKNTALLVLGRIFEEIITRYMIKLYKNRKIQNRTDEILNMRFENKLGFLKSNKFISEKDWLIISKLKLDRNVGGHFATEKSIRESKRAKKESELESEATIKLALKLINKFDKKICDLNK
jgi:hypothetical protein